MTTAPTTSSQRFQTASSPCPVCGGWSRMKQGHGERCYGYMSQDGQYAFCTREEKAGSLDLHPGAKDAYCHKLQGPCNCGIQHGATVTPIPPPKKKSTQSSQMGEPETIYTYRNEQGMIVYQALRYAVPGGGKTFRQRRPVKGEWVLNLDGVTRIPYRLPELLKASEDETVYLVEGEKDADNLARLGLIATTNVGGACNWQESCNPYFTNRRVVILPDNDEKGKLHAEQISKQLQGIAREVRIVHLPGLPHKGDVSNWLAAGGNRTQLEKLTAPRKRQFLYASEVKTEPVDYLWEKRLARGMLTLLVGDPGLGKSMLDSKLIAAITTGTGLPDGKKIEPSGVVIMAPEDSNEHTIVPRLVAAGANLSKVIILSEVEEMNDKGETYMRPISFPEDASILEEAIKECHASLAIIDPVLAMLSGKFDSHKDQDARAALGRVLTVARETNCALLGVFHLNKGQSGNVLYRSAASIAFIAMARIGLFLVPDPDNPENGRVLVNHKNNLSAKAMSLTFTIESNEDEIGYVEWQGESPYSQEQLLSQSTPTDNPKSEQETGLIEVLKENGLAMTPAEIYEKHPIGKSINALEQLLKRKLEQGLLLRPSRGLYTYNGNPLYTSKAKEKNIPVSNESSVSFNITESIVSLSDTKKASPQEHVQPSPIPSSKLTNETDMSVLDTRYNTASQASLYETDKTDTDFPVSLQCEDTSILPEPLVEPYQALLQQFARRGNIMWMVGAEEDYLTRPVFFARLKERLSSGEPSTREPAAKMMMDLLGRPYQCA